MSVLRKRIEESLKEGKETLADAEEVLFHTTKDAAEAASSYIQ